MVYVLKIALFNSKLLVDQPYKTLWLKHETTMVFSKTSVDYKTPTWLFKGATKTGWWLTYPSEKYEFLTWDHDIPN